MVLEVKGNKVWDIMIYLTSECQLTCKHCYVNTETPVKSLSLEDLKWVKETFDMEHVMLLGGEPLLYPHLAEAVNSFDKVTISTNGLLLANDNKKRDDFINLFRSKNDKISIQLSIEGNKVETDTIRGAGAWANVISAVELLKKNEIGCHIRCGYNQANLNSIPWLIDNITHPMDVPLVLFPWIGAPQLTVEQQKWLFVLIIEKNKEYNGHNLIAQPQFMQFLEQEEEGVCEAGSDRLCITYNGEITPCHFDLDYILGSIGMPLDILNTNRERFLKIRKQIQPSCTYCPNADVCRSGCYATNSYTGCPLKRQFTLKNYAYSNEIEIDSFKTQISDIKGLLEESLIC